MSDFIFVGLTLLFLALTYGFVQMCEQLMDGKS
jgi:hypothetical protein